MKIETLEVSGFTSAFKALRLPYKSTSTSYLGTLIPSVKEHQDNFAVEYESPLIRISEADMKLLKSLIKYDFNQCNAKCEGWETFRKMMEK